MAAFLIALGVVFGVVAMVVFSVVASSVIKGYVLSTLWGWFIVPIFHLPALTIVPAIGIALVISYVTHQSPPDVVEKDRSSSEKIEALLSQICLQPLVVLLFGYVVHLYM